MTLQRKPENIALKTLIMPGDLNNHGTAFGGSMLSYLDIAGAEIAMKYSKSKVLLVAVNDTTFTLPVRANDTFTIYGHVEKSGTTSMDVRLEIWRQAVYHEEKEQLAGSASFIYVAVDDNLRPQAAGKS